jgi:hypothetical protein
MKFRDFEAPIFYAFQIVNGLGSLGLFLDPRRTHQRLLKSPEKAYTILGFSETAQEMLHNVLRGQGAALLAVTVWAANLGPKHRDSYGLIATTCLLSAVANLMTAMHHRKSSIIMSAIDELTSLYGLIALNVTVGGAALAAYLNWPPGVRVEHSVTLLPHSAAYTGPHT